MLSLVPGATADPFDNVVTRWLSTATWLGVNMALSMLNAALHLLVVVGVDDDRRILLLLRLLL